MPYKSWKQAAYMHIHHPEIAKDWDAKYGSAPKKSEGSKASSKSQAMKHLKEASKKRKG